MSDESYHQHSGIGAQKLSVHPPFIWPESRVLASLASYEEGPPGQSLFMGSDLISGVLVGVDDEAIGWLDRLLYSAPRIHIRLVLVVFAAGPTHEAHLRSIDMLRKSLFCRWRNCLEPAAER